MARVDRAAKAEPLLALKDRACGLPNLASLASACFAWALEIR